MDLLDTLQDAVTWRPNLLVLGIMTTNHPNWASATATAADWDAIALMTDTTCKHPKWTPWPFDYTKETCAHCGEERRHIKGRATC